MRTARPTFLALLASSTIALSSPATAQIHAIGSVSIEERAGVSVVENVIAQANITVTIVGKPGDSVSVGVPGAVNVTNLAGQNLLLPTTSSLLYANGVILTEDTVSVSIGTVADSGVSNAPPGSYDGVIVVLAQYN